MGVVMSLKTKCVGIISLLVVFILCLQFGCISTRNSVQADTWYLNIPDTLPPAWDSKWKEIGKENIFEVTTEDETKALQLLKDLKYFKIEGDNKLLIKKPTSHLKGVPYLLRAVVYNEETGSFMISYYDNLVHVHHVSLGSYHVPMQRKAVIAFLPFEPVDVYSTCSMVR
jgi:hypothetical protein